MYMYIFQRFHFKDLNRALIFFKTNINRWYPPYFILPDLSPKKSTIQPPTTHLFQNIYIILHVCTAFTKWKTCAFSLGIHKIQKIFRPATTTVTKRKVGWEKSMVTYSNENHFPQFLWNSYTLIFNNDYLWMWSITLRFQRCAIPLPVFNCNFKGNRGNWKIFKAERPRKIAIFRYLPDLIGNNFQGVL